MKNYKLKLENLQSYSYLTLFIIAIFASTLFYNFLKDNVYSTITSSETNLNISTIRIPDINMAKFDEVSKKILNKASSKKITSSSFFR